MEHEREIRDLHALLEVAHAMAGEHSLDKLLQIIVHEATLVMEADRCSLFLHDESTKELWSKIAEKLGEMREIRFPVGVGIAGEVAKTRETVNISDAYVDPRFNRAIDHQTGYHTRSILSMPIINSQGKLIGVIQALNKKNGQAFDSQDEALMEALASHAGVALERAQLTEAYFEKLRMEETLKIAHDIQMSMLPRIFPPFPHLPQLDLYAFLQSAKEIGGDFYDFFQVDDTHVFFAIGDVTGKGVPAALFMGVVKNLLKASARRGTRPDLVLREVNTEIFLGNDSCALMTIFCGSLNIQTGEVVYASAGHNPPLHIRQGLQVDYLHTEGGLIVGVMEDVQYETHSLKLTPGDSLFLFTDGVTEAINVDREQFADTRLKHEISTLMTQPSQQMVEGIMQAIKDFSRGMPQADDITMMSIGLKPA